MCIVYEYIFFMICFDFCHSHLRSFLGDLIWSGCLGAQREKLLCTSPRMQGRPWGRPWPIPVAS